MFDISMAGLAMPCGLEDPNNKSLWSYTLFVRIEQMGKDWAGTGTPSWWSEKCEISLYISKSSHRSPKKASSPRRQKALRAGIVVQKDGDNWEAFKNQLSIGHFAPFPPAFLSLPYSNTEKEVGF